MIDHKAQHHPSPRPSPSTADTQSNNPPAPNHQPTPELFPTHTPEPKPRIAVRPRARKLTQSRARELGLLAPSPLGKNFVLDTNVLLHDPGCLNHFADNHLCIPVDVLAELDRFKGEPSERGANARRVHRELSALFTDEATPTASVPTQGGGSIRLVVYDPAHCQKGGEQLEQFHRVLPDQQRTDHRILAATLMVAKYNQPPVSLVTKDLNLQLKARSLGIPCEDYLNDKVALSEATHRDIPHLHVDPSELQRFASSGTLQLPPERLTTHTTNDYLLLQAGPKQTIPARLNPQGTLQRLRIPDGLKIPDGAVIKPLNLGQKCLLDALLDPTISLVTCYGQAGTGKTLLAMAAGLSEVFSRTYNGLTVSRPVVAMGDQLGFLPGTLNEKMRPWLQPIYDALELLSTPPQQHGPRRKQQRKDNQANPQKPYEPLIEQGIIEIEALCYIRGRSIPNRYFILDEAQQLTPQEAKTVVTRISRGSKLVLVGDPAQIDHPYVDSRSNGLVYTRKKLHGQPFSAHIPLSKGERSDLAEAGAQLM